VKRVLFTLLFLLGLTSTAYAQTGACPTTNTLVVVSTGWVCVTPAADYNVNTLGPDGVTQVPIVVRMDLLLFNPTVTDTATGAPTLTVNIGKPSPNSNGAVWAQVSALTTIPQGQQFKARVVSVGQPLTAGGAAQVSARSPESNPFIRPAPPAAPLAPLSVAIKE
jgi:hypothetical protein